MARIAGWACWAAWRCWRIAARMRRSGSGGGARVERRESLQLLRPLHSQLPGDASLLLPAAGRRDAGAAFSACCAEGEAGAAASSQLVNARAMEALDEGFFVDLPLSEAEQRVEGDHVSITAEYNLNGAVGMARGGSVESGGRCVSGKVLRGAYAAPAPSRLPVAKPAARGGDGGSAGERGAAL